MAPVIPNVNFVYDKKRQHIFPQEFKEVVKYLAAIPCHKPKVLLPGSFWFCVKHFYNKKEYTLLNF